MKEEMLKLLQFVSKFASDFEDDVKESHLEVNRLKTRARNAKNRLAIETVRENRGYESSESSNQITGNSMEILRIHDSVEPLEDMTYVFPTDWRNDVGERSSRVAQWWSKFHL